MASKKVMRKFGPQFDTALKEQKILNSKGFWKIVLSSKETKMLGNLKKKLINNKLIINRGTQLIKCASWLMLVSARFAITFKKG